MAGWIKRTGTWLGSTILGLALWIGYVSVCDVAEDATTTRLSSMPDQVLGGGDRVLQLTVEVTEDAEFYAEFAPNSESILGYEEVEVRFDLQAGRYTYEVAVPDHTYVLAQVTIHQPEVGAYVYLASRASGEWLYSDEETLDAPLTEGYAFFAQLEFDDWGGWGF